MAPKQLRTILKSTWPPRPNLLVRKLVFSRVYYNNGNSLGDFSIPSCWGVSSWVGRRLSLPFSSATQAELSIAYFGDNCFVHLACSVLVCFLPHRLAARKFTESAVKMDHFAVAC